MMEQLLHESGNLHIEEDLQIISRDFLDDPNDVENAEQASNEEGQQKELWELSWYHLQIDEDDTVLALHSGMSIITVVHLLRAKQRLYENYLHEHTVSCTCERTNASSSTSNSQEVPSFSSPPSQSQSPPSPLQQPFPPISLTLHRIMMDFHVATEIVAHMHLFTDDLEFVHCKGDYIYLVLEAALRHCRKIVIGAKQMDHASLFALSNGLHPNNASGNLEELCLRIDVSQETVEMLFAGINSLQAPSLATLDLSQCDIASDAIDDLIHQLANNYTLRTLKLDNCRLEDEEIHDLIVYGLCRQTDDRSQQRQQLGQRQSDPRTAQQEDDHPTIEHLVLSQNYMEDLTAIVRLLELSSTMRSLDIGQQNPGVLDLSMLLQVAPTMSLKSLSLKESYLENIDGSFLSRLQTLNIQNCDITENDAQQLVPFVVSSTALQELHWKDNHFDAANFESIFETALRHNTTLQWVDTYCCIGDDDDDSHGNNNNNNNKSIDANEDEQNNSSCIGRIRHWLWLNRCGRKYIASHTLPIKLWPYLLSRISRLARTAGKPACTSGRECDAIYFLLSNHMELWMYV